MASPPNTAEDILQNAIAFGGAITLEPTSLHFGRSSMDNVELVVERIDVNGARQIQQLWSLLRDGGEPLKYYYVASPSSYRVSMQNVAGPASSLATFVREYGGFDDMDDATIITESNTNNHAEIAHCVISQFGFSLNVQSIAVTETVELMAGAIDYKEPTTTAQGVTTPA